MKNFLKKNSLQNRIISEIEKNCLILSIKRCEYVYEKNLDKDERFVIFKSYFNEFDNFVEMDQSRKLELLKKSTDKFKNDLNIAQKNSLFIDCNFLRIEYINNILYSDFIICENNIDSIKKYIEKINFEEIILAKETW